MKIPSSSMQLTILEYRKQNMRVSFAKLFALGVLAGSSEANPVQPQHISQVHPFTVNLSSRVPRMLEQIRNTRLLSQPVYTDAGNADGISLHDLQSLQKQWLTAFDWESEQKEINKYCFFFQCKKVTPLTLGRFKHYTTVIEGLTIHFVHERSNATDAIPLVLLHGWPGSFLEFTPIIEELTKQATTATGKKVSFDVIVPSLPGFAFSSASPINWTISDSARVINTLLTQVLHYDTYALFGTDFGAGIGYDLYDQYNTTVRAAHFAFLPFLALNSAQLKAQNITLNALEAFEQSVTTEWSNSGEGYFIEHTTKVCHPLPIKDSLLESLTILIKQKPNTIGLALQDNAVGQLAWIGEKFLNCKSSHYPQRLHGQKPKSQIHFRILIVHEQGLTPLPGLHPLSLHTTRSSAMSLSTT